MEKLGKENDDEKQKTPEHEVREKVIKLSCMISNKKF